MGTQTFGNNVDGTSIGTIANVMRWPKAATHGTMYQAPCNGTLVGLYTRTDDANGNVRVGLYTAAGALIAQGSAEVAGQADVWVGHTSFVDGAGSATTPTLVSGTEYLIAITGDGTLTGHRTAVTSGDAFTNSTDYTADMPDNFPAATNSGYMATSRAVVEESGGSSVVPKVMAMRRHRA